MDLDKINIQGMLDKFKHTRDGLDKTFRDIFASDDKTETDDDDIFGTTEPEEDDFPEPPIEPEQPSKPDKVPEPVYTKPAEQTENSDFGDVITRLDKLSEKLDAPDTAAEYIEEIQTEIGRVIRLTENVTSKVNNLNEKIASLNTSLAGVSKLNDSIFDLKNSQMNTKNTLAELEGAFYGLKKKMKMGVMLISILTTIIAVLEILNLLS